MLFGWPLAVLFLLRTYSTKQAILYSMVFSTLLLPVMTIDPPLLPPLNKLSITSLALLFCLFVLGRRFRLFEPGLITKFILAYFSVIFISAVLNSDPVESGIRILPGLSIYDALTSIFKMLIYLVPFLLGRYYFKAVEDNEWLFKFLVVSALIYSVPMLFEIRMSPQLHNWIYGFSPTVFAQQMRGGGFRPFVFIGHGLPLAFWFSTCVIIAVALYKNKVRCSPLTPFVALSYMLIVLVLCKTVSAMIYATLGLFFVYKIQPLKQAKWAFILSILVLMYPISKLLGVFPTAGLVSFVDGLSADRAQSLLFRFDNEEILLNHAIERPFFGWGGWGRNRLFDEFGKDLVVTDGRWIIEFGINGFLGFFLYYAILITPLFYATKAICHIKEKKQQYYFSTLAIVLVVSIIDSVPNTNMGSIQLLLAGALLGQSEFLISNALKKQGEIKQVSYVC